MIMRVGPALCQTYKALTASDLYERYQGVGGQHRLEIDLAVASEISDQVRESIDKGKGGDAKSMVARRDQRRSQRASQAVSDDGALKLLKDAGIVE